MACRSCSDTRVTFSSNSAILCNWGTLLERTTSASSLSVPIMIQIAIMTAPSNKNIAVLIAMSRRLKVQLDAL
ncbi:hypothetical protein D3C87_2019640 [compost metagenome]